MTAYNPNMALAALDAQKRHEDAQRAALVERVMSQYLPNRHELMEHVSTAQQALATATAQRDQAQQALDRHSATAPAADDVPAWARRKVELASEVDGYSLLVQRASDDVRSASSRLQQARRAAFDSALASARRDMARHESEGGAAVKAALDAWKAAQARYSDEAQRLNSYHEQLSTLSHLI